MKNEERILAYKLSQPLTEEDLKDVSASGTSVATGNFTYSAGGGIDGSGDVTYDW